MIGIPLGCYSSIYRNSFVDKLTGVVNVAKTIAYAGLGAITVQSVLAGLWLVPAAVLGAWLGVVAHRAIPERGFFLVTYTLLLAAGTKLIFDAVT